MEVLNYFKNMYQLLSSKQGDCKFLVEFEEKSTKKWQYAGVHLALILLVNLCCLIAVSTESDKIWWMNSGGIVWVGVFSLIQVGFYILSVKLYMHTMNSMMDINNTTKRYHYLVNLFLYCMPMYHLLQIIALTINAIFYMQAMLVLFMLVHFIFLKGVYQSYERNHLSKVNFYIMGTVFGFIFARFNIGLASLALCMLQLI